MAIWQYTAYLLPVTAIAPDGSIPGLNTGEDPLDIPDVPFSVMPDEIESVLAAYLPPAESWSPEIRTWGDSQKDDVQAVFEQGRFRQICARLDLRDITKERIARLLTLAQQLNCFLVEARTLEPVPATEEAIVASISKSAPAAFVRDPQGFLLAAKSRNRDNQT